MKVILKKKRMIDHSKDRVCQYCGNPMPAHKTERARYCCIGCAEAAYSDKTGYIRDFQQLNREKFVTDSLRYTPLKDLV